MKTELMLTYILGEKTPVFIAFSMYTNGQKLLACRKTKTEHTMECLNGMRVFSALWVIYAHAHVMTMIAPTFNFAYIPEVNRIQSIDWMLLFLLQIIKISI